MTNQSNPIIVRITKQDVVSERPNPYIGGHVTVIRNEGTDKQGKRWTWLSEHITRPDGLISYGSDYAWKEVQS